MASDRTAFAGRLRLQLRARYQHARVEVDAARFALRVIAPGIDLSLPLAPLQHACDRDPKRSAVLIAEYVASIEQQLTPRESLSISPARLLWCVRTERYLEGLTRAGSLLTAGVGAGLVAFVAEELPGSIMRGVPKEQWQAAGLTDSAVRTSVDRNTAHRFTGLVERIQRVDRIPADGWRIAAEPLFQASVLVVPAVLAALAAASRGDVLLGVPDRGVVLALPASLPSADRFARRVQREWREAMNPCTRELLITDGTRLRGVPRTAIRSGVVMPWLAS